MILLALLALIGGALDDLSSDDIEVRQAAAAELYRQGAKALLDARREATDLEAVARLDDLLRRRDVEDRISGFGGENRVAGFGLTLRSDRFFGRGPFRLTVEVMNVDAAPQVFPGLARWDVERPDEETKLQCAEAKLSVKKFIRGGFPRTRWTTGSGQVGVPVVLKPGESTTYETTLDAKSLPAGDYDVKVEYYAAKLIPDAEENLRSNAVRLTIR